MAEREITLKIHISPHDKRIILSMDLDYAAMYPDLGGERKRAYELAIEWSLEYLALQKLSITFFCCPEDAAMFPHCIRTMRRAGHQIGLHIHTIEAHTPSAVKRRILAEGTKLLEDMAGRTIRWHRGGMFFLDQETVLILKELNYVGDSSLVPDRCLERWVAGKYDTGHGHLKYNMPMDYRGFPTAPYYVQPSFLEVPPSRYCMDFLQPDKMRRAIEEDIDDLSVIYIHPKNLDGMVLKESIEGKMKEGFLEVIGGLKKKAYKFSGYEDVLNAGGYPERFEVFKKLYVRSSETVVVK